jgi:RNA polymerase sigma-70 factor (ECF subfamily)
MSEEGMLPESSAGEGGSMEEYVARLDSSLSTAFLLVMESLTPAERTVLLLQKVFGYDRTEVAFLVGESEADCSRIAGRAKRSAVARRPRFENASGRKEDPC